MAQQLTKVRGPNGEITRLADWTSAEPLYSTVDVGAGAFTVLQAFSYGKNGAVPGSVGSRKATYVDTNLRGQGGKLPEDEAIQIHSIAIEVFLRGTDAGSVLPQADAPNVNTLEMMRLQRDILVELKIAAVKNYTQHPLSWFPAGSGVHQSTAGGRSVVAGVGNGFSYSNNGGTGPADQRQFASPLTVMGGEALTVDFTAGPGQVEGLQLGASSRFSLRTTLNGPRKRPIA